MILGQSSMISGAVGWPAIAASLALVVFALVVARVIGLAIEGEILWASFRAAAQLLVVGLVFAWIFQSAFALGWSWLWVGLMTVVGTATVLQRANHPIPGLPLVAAGAILVSAIVSIAITFGFSVVEYSPVSLVVIAGITIGNAVPSTALGVNQAVTLCRDRASEIEALLSLGLDRRQVVRFMAPRAAHSALIPQVDRTKVVGLIALPGALTGLLLAGADPVEAVVVQLLVMYLVLGATALCVVAGVAAVTSRVVTRGVVVADWARPGGNES